MVVEDHSVSLEETIVPVNVRECVDLISKVLCLPTLENLREIHLIASKYQEISSEATGCKTYRGNLYFTAKGLMERETWTEYTTPDPVDFPYDQKSEARGVATTEIGKMVQKYSITPDKLRPTVTSIEEQIESE